MLASCYRLILITRGDLFDQERKLAASGLEPFFHAIEIVSDKNAATYGRVFSRYGDGPERAVMVGNSLRSDVIPALEAGSWGVHVPQESEWIIERADPPLDAPRFRGISRLGELPEILAALRRFDAKFDRAWGKSLRQAKEMQRRCATSPAALKAQRASEAAESLSAYRLGSPAVSFSDSLTTRGSLRVAAALHRASPRLERIDPL
jgi:hypothetical protein